MSRKWKFRKLAVSSLLALSALSVALPAGAQSGTSTTTPATAEADLLRRVETLRTQRQNELAIELLTPLAATTRNFEVFRALGRNTRELRTPADCLKAVEFFNKALELKKDDLNVLRDRAGAYDCLGRPFLVQRLNDRERVVELQEVGGRMATAADYSDKGGAENALALPSPESVVDISLARRAVESYSKSLALDPTRLGTRRDRADVLITRLSDVGAGYNDYDEALRQSRQRDMSVPNNARELAITARRFAARTGPAGMSATNFIVAGRFDGLNPARNPDLAPRANAIIAQLRNEARDYYTRYIEAFEERARTQSLEQAFATLGGLDFAGALADRAAVFNAMNERQKALEDLKRRTEIESREPNYWRDLGIQYELMGNRDAALNAYREFQELVGNVHHNNSGDVAARVRRLGG